MGDKRSQGRPCRGGNEVGSDRIIGSLRDMLRSRRMDCTSRKSLAEFAGITPALITYYFPDKDSLIEEATKPIIEEYARQLSAILRQDEAPDIKLRKVIGLLISCYERDAGILDAYSELARQKGEALQPNYVAMMTEELAKFFGDWFDQGTTQAHHPAMLQGALWGMCQFVAQVNLARELSGMDESLIADLDRVTPIYCIMIGGLDRLRVHA
jgi:AcrR family transcriptional regulator